MIKNFNSNYVHHQNSKIVPLIREIVFGMEDGMVSTLGAISGIAIGSGNQAIVLLSGLVIISVESISMAIGSYISNKSEHHIDRRKIHEESEEIKKFPEDEKEELLNLYIKDGWPMDLAQEMTEVAIKDEKLILKEMSHRELGVKLEVEDNCFQKSLAMFFSYIIGGAIPLSVYFFLHINIAIYFSVIITLLGLFILGTITSKYTKQNWFKSGIKILLLGGIALLIGTLIGKLFNVS